MILCELANENNLHITWLVTFYVIFLLYRNSNTNKMKTRNTTTRFMNGNIDVDGEILDILTAEFGMAAVMECEIDFSDAIYSDGFIHAIENGLIPQIDTIAKSFESKKEGEYHHVIYNDECYVIYFK